MTILPAMIAAFGLLAAVRCSSGHAAGQESPPHVPPGDHRLPYQLRDGLIYVKARVNGKRATLPYNAAMTNSPLGLMAPQKIRSFVK